MNIFSVILGICFCLLFALILQAVWRKSATAPVLTVLATFAVALAALTYMPALDSFEALGIKIHLDTTILAAKAQLKEADEKLARLALLNAKVTYKAEAQALTQGVVGKTQERLDEVDRDLAGQKLTEEQWRGIREPFLVKLKNTMMYRIIDVVDRVVTDDLVAKANNTTQLAQLQSYRQQAFSIIGQPTWAEVRQTLQPPSIVPPEVRGRLMAYVDRAIGAYEASERTGRVSAEAIAILDASWPDQLATVKRIRDGK